MLKGFWRKHWFWVFAIAMFVPVFVVAAVAWQIAGKPVSGTEGLVLQEQMLIAVVQSPLAYALTISTMHTIRRSKHKEEEEQARGTRALCSALVVQPSSASITQGR